MRVGKRIVELIWNAANVGYALIVFVIIADMFRGGGAGTLSISLIVAGVLCSIQLVAGGLLGGRKERIARFIWCGLVLAVLSLGVSIFFARPISPNGNNADIVVFFCMMALTLPIGLLVSAMFAATGSLLNFYVGSASPLVFIFLIWVFMSLFGAFQWFYFWPRFASKLRQRLSWL